MCGIAGCIGLDKQITEDVFRKVSVITSELSHRGPDDEGYFSDSKIAFGHRRLAIIDLNPNSSQPMTDSEEDIIIVFNGEIYNHEELRNELEPYYDFKTNHSDTEVVIYAYKRWGLEFVHKLNGMFAIAIYDKPKQEVLLLRDRLGKKPLYYTITSGYLYFCSEINPLFTANIIQKNMNENALYNYLTFLTTPAPETFYENILKLESGYLLHIKNGKPRKKSYWDIAQFINRRSEIGSIEAISVTEELLEKAAYYRNIADVPISIALSGGLDSSFNLYYSKKFNNSINTVNLAYIGKSRYDESFIAEKYSKELDVQFMPLTIDDQTIKNTIAEYLNVQKDMPTGDPNTILLYYISKIIHQEGIKVLLVGEGGDEIGGYPIYLKLQKEYNQLRKFGPLLNNLSRRLPTKYARKYDCFYQEQVISKRHIHGFFEIEKKQFWLGNKEYNSYEHLNNFMSEIRNDLSDSFLRKILNIEYKLRLPELILARIDYPTMATSVEARSPFMDYKLIEFSSSLDFSIKMKNGAKTILKNIAKDKLPKYILTHPKIGFGMLLKPFFRKTLPKWYYHELIASDAPIHQFISKIYIKKLYSQNKIRNLGSKLWMVYSLNKWIEYNDL